MDKNPKGVARFCKDTATGELRSRKGDISFHGAEINGRPPFSLAPYGIDDSLS